MKQILFGVALVLNIGVIVCSCVARAAGVDDSVQSQYQGKQVMLRDFYCGNKLKFDAEGKLVRGGPSGPWTLCRDIRIDKIGIKDGKLKIEGQRIPLFYDSKQQQFRNVLEVVDKEGESYEQLVSKQRVSIEALLPPGPDGQTLAATLDKLFYSSDEEFTEAVPDFWKSFFRPPPERKGGSNSVSDSHTLQGEQPQDTDSTGPTSQAPAKDGRNKVLHVGNGGTPPVPVYLPYPDYSEPAREIRYRGTAVITIIIRPDGKVYDPRVSRPVGLGLDEKARDKVLTWKFRPGTKDGKPVAMKLSLEVQFNLY